MDDLLDIFNLVRDFIVSNKLILYGGMAVDFALKHRGYPGIYDKDETPDYDFYTYDMKMAFQLADILFAKYDDINVINAWHVQTLRVRWGKTVVADISFMPKNIFDIIPTINYIDNDKMIRIIHPKFKMADIHKAFISPTRGCPNEAVFQRFQKDMDRYNLLDEAYLDKPIISYKREDVTLTIDKVCKNKKYLIGGILAYYFITQEFEKLFPNNTCDYIKIKTLKRSESSFILNIESLSELKPIFIVENIISLGLNKAEYRSPFMDDLIPKSAITKHSIFYEYLSSITKHSVSINFNNKTYSYDIINIHGLMLYFITKSFMDISYKKSPYYQYYVSLINIIKNVQVSHIDKDQPFYINMNMFNEIEPPEYLIKLHEIHNRKHNIKNQVWPLPTYYPKNNQEHPAIKDHILLYIGYEVLKDLNPYQELLKHGTRF